MNFLRTATLAIMLNIAPPAWAQPDRLPLPQDNRFIKLSEPNRWSSRFQITVTAYGATDRRAIRERDGTYKENTRIFQDVWQFEQLMVVAPVIIRTASAVHPDPDADELVRGSLTISDVTTDTDPTIIGPYHSQAVYARWDAPAMTATGLRLIQHQDLICYETEFDEDAAMELAWPDRWPPEADSTFGPQQFVTISRADRTTQRGPGDPDPIEALIAEWTEGQDPRSIPPVQLAKWLAGRVQEHVRIVRSSRTTRQASDGGPLNSTGYTAIGNNPVTHSAQGNFTSGFNVQNAELTAVERQGTRHDITVLLAAVYRRVGLPARIVVGYHEKAKSRSDRVWSWVEFALFDEGLTSEPEDDLLVWVPVDVARLRKRSSRAYSMDSKWKYFGTHDLLDDIAPIALHFHPPTAVRSYTAPAFYGWAMDPGEPTRADQYIDIDVSHTPNRGKTPGQD